MTRFKQKTTLDPSFVAAKLEEFFSEDNIQEDITTLSTQEDKKQVRAALIANVLAYTLSVLIPRILAARGF